MPDFLAYNHPDPKTWVTYQAGCHCGKARFAVYMPSLSTLDVVECNCSICSINGYLNVYPYKKDVVFESDYNELGKYAFNTGKRYHRFCQACGTSLLIELPLEPEPFGDRFAINVRTFKDVDISGLKLEPFNGKKIW